MAAQDGAEAIHTAAGGGDVEEVRRLLDQDSGLLEARTGEEIWGMTPLTCAALKGHIEVARLLLDRGAEVDLRSVHGDTALHMAAIRGHEEVVAFLLSRGADASAKDNEEDTTLHKGSWDGHVGVVRVLLQHLRGRGLDDQDSDGRTALWYASLSEHTEVARALFLAGADHTITGLHFSSAGGYQTAPLQEAEMNDDEDTVILFESAPSHLRPRSRPPEVEIVASADSGEEEQKRTGSGQRKGAEQGVGEGPCEGEKQATLQYVMQDLAPELYIELMAGFH